MSSVALICGEPGGWVKRALVLGGYGAFGRRVAERLARAPGSEVIIAGRSRIRADACARELAPAVNGKVIPADLDGEKIGVETLTELKPTVLINATGPYQSQNYRLARTCIAAGVHYVDLADASAFVAGIGALDAEAKRAGVLVASGASTVPAVSAAAVDAHVHRFAVLERVMTVISPGNDFDPGLATAQSILRTLGRPITGTEPGGEVRGWQGLRRLVLPGLGPRWIGHCDAPDRGLFPARYPGLQRADVYAALEVGMFHLGLWGVSWLARSGLLRDPERLAAALLAAKRRLHFVGSDRGGMLVRMEGRDKGGRGTRVDWQLVAGSGHGPYIPATPTVLLAKRLLDGTLAARGAVACVGLFTLADFMAEVGDLDITAGSA